MDVRWFLYNTGRDEKLEGLTPEATFEVLANIEDANLIDWHAWLPGWKDWQPVDGVDELMKGREYALLARLTPPEPPKSRREFSNTQPGVHPKIEANLSAPDAGNAITNNRAYLRYDARLRVVLMSAGQSFRTYSSNVSYGGIQLEKPIPEAMIRQPLEIYISSPDAKDSIRFISTLVGDPSNACHFKFLEQNTEFKKKLEDWLHLLQAQIQNEQKRKENKAA